MTNPSVGRGQSLGVLHAQLLRRLPETLGPPPAAPGADRAQMLTLLAG